MKNKKLSLTVGITTCYGDNSILDTVKSIRASKGVQKFEFIIVADRVAINPWLKSELKKNKVKLIENKVEGSQITKQKQILKLTKNDLIIFTQDDVLFDPLTLKTVIAKFRDHSETTMVSILNKPVKPTNFFESILNTGTNIANNMAKKWNGGDNYLSVIGRFMAFKTEFMKNKITLKGEVATSDTYYYLENKRNLGVYKYLPNTSVYFKNPQNMKEHLRKSSRFQYSKLEMSQYFPDIDLEREYKIPIFIIAKSIAEEFIKSPVATIFYFLVYFYSRLLKLKPSYVLNAIWEVDLSTKKISR
jgi:cellulose synthase/poly-beta-1,6-N-acetylglucosamine synthase-like glycosyltransferase